MHAPALAATHAEVCEACAKASIWRRLDADERVVHLHVEKTAGSSFISTLVQTMFGKRARAGGAEQTKLHLLCEVRPTRPHGIHSPCL
jgi:hypothetical protein